MTTPPIPGPPMTPPAAAAPRWMRVLLVVSLALNLLVAGLLLGDALAGGHGPRPAGLALGPIARALDEDDRRAILLSLRGHPNLRPLGQGERDRGLREIAGAVRAEPFDPDRLRAALSAQSDRVIQAQDAVRDALLARLAAMPPEERTAFAGRLEQEDRRP